MYDAQQLLKDFEKIEHGKSRIAAIRFAIRLADENHDLPYQLGFRMDLCYESNFYHDSMDMMVVFPEALALVDKFPDIPATPDADWYKNGLARVLDVYKWVINTCDAFYQIPYEDCMKFFEDFKRRSIAFGYNLKPYYKTLYNFFEVIDEAQAEQYFKEFQKLPKDDNGDCKACDRNFEISYYLFRKKRVDIADKLAKDIENMQLRCGTNTNYAWLRLKGRYLEYYLEQKDYEKAGEYVRLLEQYSRNEKMSEYDYDDAFFLFYTHMDMGKALKIYKKDWKEWFEERCPYERFYLDSRIALFFRELGKQRKGNTIKLKLNPTFPLYSEDGIYSIQELEKFYYNNAKDIAVKFDQRNGSKYYQKELEALIQ